MERTRPSNELDRALAVASSATKVKTQGIVHKLWSADHPLRLALTKHQLPPHLADEFDKLGVYNLDLFEEHHIELIAKSQDASCRNRLKTKLYEMWKATEAGQRKETERAEAEAKHQQRTDNAKNSVKETMQSLRERMRSTQDNRAQPTSARFRCNDDDNGRELDPFNMADFADNVTNSMARAQFSEDNRWNGAPPAAVPGTQHSSDIDIIVKTSAGLALTGVRIGMSPAVVDETPPNRLIQQPASACVLGGARVSTTYNETFLKTQQAKTKHQAAVISVGSTLATSLEASGWGAHFEASTSHDSTKSTEAHNKSRHKSSYMVRVIWCVVPTKSFELDGESLRLSKDAIRALGDIDDLPSAKTFLHDFGSHIPCGVQHLGGMMWVYEEATSTESLDESELRKAFTTSTAVAVGGGANGFGVNVNGGVQHEANRSNENYNKNQSVHSSISKVTSHIFHGPAPAQINLNSFQDAINTDNTSWRLIDRGTHERMMPVWELVQKMVPKEQCDARTKYQQVVDVLRDAWLEEACKLTWCEVVQWLIERQRRAHLQSVIRIVDRVCEVSLDHCDAREFRRMVLAMVARLDLHQRVYNSTSNENFPRDELQQLFEILKVHREHPNVQPALQALRRKYTRIEEDCRLVGGRGGGKFQFNGDSTLTKIGLWDRDGQCLSHVKLWFANGSTWTGGSESVNNYTEYTFDHDELIRELVLWEGPWVESWNPGYRTAKLVTRIEVTTTKGRKFACGTSKQCKRVEVNVHSGRVVGVEGRKGDMIDSLGFVFRSSPDWPHRCFGFSVPWLTQ